VTEAIDAGAPGMVRVHGELWRAVASRPIPAGARVRVVEADGLTLRVTPKGE
jgi:membrane-bound ClpP family serine protease